MGTKIEYYSINPLAYSVDCNNFTVDGVDVWEHNLKKGLAYNNQCSIGVNKLQAPMDKMLDRNNMESIKKTMQMHEEIFKHQVRELHRVYSVQKMLMNELKTDIKQNKFWTPMNSIGISNPYVVQQHHQTTQIISYGTDIHVPSLREDLHVKERSGSCSGERNMKRQRDFDLERPAERDIFASGCDEGEAGPSSNTAFECCKISNDDGDMEVDLSLSIGGSSNHVKKNKPYLLPLGFSDSSPKGKTREFKFNSSVSFQSDNKVGDCSDPTTPMSSSSVTFDQEKRGPHWLSQGLRLK